MIWLICNSYTIYMYANVGGFFLLLFVCLVGWFGFFWIHKKNLTDQSHILMPIESSYLLSNVKNVKLKSFATVQHCSEHVFFLVHLKSAKTPLYLLIYSFPNTCLVSFFLKETAEEMKYDLISGSKINLIFLFPSFQSLCQWVQQDVEWNN